MISVMRSRLPTSNSVVLWSVLFLRLCTFVYARELEDYTEQVDDSAAQVQVRAVLVGCKSEAPEDSGETDIGAKRFHREELFKHGALRDCRKKLALTIKITNKPGKRAQLRLADEYIPIEHVLEGPEKRRVRLLDPYVLRLRRDVTLEAYSVKTLEVINGVLTKKDASSLRKSKDNYNKGRHHREISGESLSDELPIYFQPAKSRFLGKMNERDSLRPSLQDQPDSGSKEPSDGGVTQEEPILSTVKMEESNQTYIENQLKAASTANVINNVTSTAKPPDSVRRVTRDTCVNTFLLWKRNKRHEHNIIIQDNIDEDKNPIWMEKDRADSLGLSYQGNKIRDTVPAALSSLKDQVNYKEFETKTFDEPKSATSIAEENDSSFNSRTRRKDTSKIELEKNQRKHEAKSVNAEHLHENNVKQKRTTQSFEYTENDKEFTLYTIGQPQLWFGADIQLFRKISDPDGHTRWRDVIQGEVARVSTTKPSWSRPEMSVQYRPLDGMRREQFILPKTDLYLLVKHKSDRDEKPEDSLDDDIIEPDYIVVPVRDVLGAEHLERSRKSNVSEPDSPIKRDRRVIVQTARALLSDEKLVSLVSQGSTQYLTVPHRKVNHAQIDLEVRADDDLLVRVGTSGRISTVVTDSTRPARTIISVQASNTGLASARFRAITKDCKPESPELLALLKEDNEATTTESTLLPPHHTRKLKLELPVDIPSDVVRCEVALVNDHDESVAIREVTIKKGDHCFCVWYCDCVCLSDDPKLLCKEMTEPRLSAAGLEKRDRPRHSRSICYEDLKCLNSSVAVLGVLMAMLLLGLIKAILGLMCNGIGIWGLSCIIDLPRPLQCYQESSLRDRPVQYDEAGWPVHPDTKQRTVRVLSMTIQFFLNTIFFLMLPCVVIRNLARAFSWNCQKSKSEKVEEMGHNKREHSNLKPNSNLYNSMDMQGSSTGVRRLRCRRTLHPWMTPGAEKLSTDLWDEALTPFAKNELILPLLGAGERRGEDAISSCVDSEQDTEYVLMQMQKSRESLAKCQRNSSCAPGPKDQRKK